MIEQEKDIVERLRLSRETYISLNTMAPLMLEAADEIEFLRARIAKLIDSYGQDDIVGQERGNDEICPNQLYDSFKKSIVE